MNFLKKNTGLLLRFDDIAPNMNWKMMNKCEKLFLNYNIKPVLGIIPKNEDNELLSFQFKENFWEKVKHWQSLGWEISIHGYNHKYSLDTRKKDYFKELADSYNEQLDYLVKNSQHENEKNKSA